MDINLRILCAEFIEVMVTLKEEGKISQEEFDEYIKLKKRFLNKSSII